MTTATLTAPMPSPNGTARVVSIEEARAASATGQERFNRLRALIARMAGWPVTIGREVWARIKSAGLKAMDAAKAFFGSHAVPITAGASAIMAIPAVVRKAGEVTVKTVHKVAQGGLWLAKQASKVGTAIGNGIARFVGWFSKPAGQKVSGWNARLTDWRNRQITWLSDKVDTFALKSLAVATADSTVRTIAVGSGVLAAGITANAISGGIVAETVATTVPLFGLEAAAVLSGSWLVFPALGILALGALAFTALFNRQQASEQLTARLAKPSIPAPTGPVVPGTVVTAPADEQVMAEAQAVIDAVEPVVEPTTEMIEVDGVLYESLEAAELTAEALVANQLADEMEAALTGRPKSRKQEQRHGKRHR